MTIRANSAFYGRVVLGTAVKLGVAVTARQDQEIRAAIEAIDEDAWTPIPYWLSTPEVSDADVAETSYTGLAVIEPIGVRIVVRRSGPPRLPAGVVRYLDYHAFVTNRPVDVLEVEADHRRHAVVEQRIAELKSAALKHLPSGKFMANAASLALTAMAHNLGRAVGTPRRRRPGHREHSAARVLTVRADWSPAGAGDTRLSTYGPGHTYRTRLVNIATVSLRC